MDTFKCVSCKIQDADKEMGRCSSCKTEHDKLCAELEARPKNTPQKPPTDWVYYTQVKEGVVVKTFMTREEARLMGKRLPDE